jgi:hypothetical protein
LSDNALDPHLCDTQIGIESKYASQYDTVTLTTYLGAEISTENVGPC